MTFHRATVIRWSLSAVLAAACCAAGPRAGAQSPPQSAEDEQLESLLTGADLFFKKYFNEDQQRWEYQVAWSQDGETSMMTFYVRPIATLGDGTRVCVAYVWTQVLGMGQGEELPPAIIKAVAGVNDTLFTGNVSAAGNGVFANTGMVMKDLTSDTLWIYLWDLHDTRVLLKKEFEKLLAGG